jgi:hypothetical protein
MKNSAHISGNWITNLIRDFISTSPHNTMKNKTADPAWDDALVGFASGADPIWQQYKEYVGAFHWTPWEVFNQNCPGESAGAAELTVDAAFQLDHRQLSAVLLCIFLVRTPCRPCGRSGHLRSVRRPHHRKGKSHAGWIGGCPDIYRANSPTVFRPPGLLSLFRQWNLR